MQIRSLTKVQKQVDNVSTEGFDDLFQPPRLAKPEMHLLLKPFFLLDRHADRLKPIQYVYSAMERGKAVTRRWFVQPHALYGLPGAFDRDVTIAIYEIVAEQYLAKRLPVPRTMPIGTFRDFAKRMGINPSGKNLSAIKESLKRLKNTLIDAEETFFDNKAKRYISTRITLFQGIVFSGNEDQNGIKHEQNFVVFDDSILSNLNSGYVMVVDIETMRRFKSNIAKQLYVHLAYRFFVESQDGDEQWVVDYEWLTIHLGIKPQSQLWRAKQQLEQANTELKDLGYITDYLWDGWRIIYRPGPVWEGEQLRRKSGKSRSAKQALSHQSPAQQEPKDSGEAVEPLYRALLLFASGLPMGQQRIRDHGLTEEAAIQLCKEKSIQIQNK